MKITIKPSIFRLFFLIIKDDKIQESYDYVILSLSGYTYNNSHHYVNRNIKCSKLCSLTLFLICNTISCFYLQLNAQERCYFHSFIFLSLCLHLSFMRLPYCSFKEPFVLRSGFITWKKFHRLRFYTASCFTFSWWKCFHCKKEFSFSFRVYIRLVLCRKLTRIAAINVGKIKLL